MRFAQEISKSLEIPLGEDRSGILLLRVNFAVHERILANGFDNSNGNETSEPTAASASSPGSSNANHNKHNIELMTN